MVQANSANLSGATLALQFGTYISSGFTAASTDQPHRPDHHPDARQTITDTTLAGQNAHAGPEHALPVRNPAESGITPLSIANDPSGQQVLQLHLLPRSTGAKNADGSPGLNLSGEAKNQFPFTASALATDDELGAAVATSLTVYNTPGVPGSGINVAASQQQAQQVFSQFAPDVSGGTREIAIMLTDQASGPVAARQRLLRSYGNVPGDMTLWGEEFTGQINNKGRVSADGTLTSYKDHGFGFVLGVDGGSPRNGWYGGAFTFYSGDVTQQLPRATRTNTEWYMLTGYTDWRGKHVFLDTQVSAAYGDFAETRVLNVGGLVRDATSKPPRRHAGAGRQYRRDAEIFRLRDRSAYQPGRHDPARGRLSGSQWRSRLQPGRGALFRQFGAHRYRRGHQDQHHDLEFRSHARNAAGLSLRPACRRR